MSGIKSPEDNNQDMRDGWVDGSCSELLNDIFKNIAAFVAVLVIVGAAMMSACKPTPTPEVQVVTAPTDVPVSVPVSQSVVSNSSDLAVIQQAMAARTVPAIDEQTCSQQLAGGMTNKYEDGICYIHGPQDPPDQWTAIGVEYPEFSCERRLQPGLSTSYDANAQTCTVTYNGTTTAWSWTGSSWKQQ